MELRTLGERLPFPRFRLCCYLTKKVRFVLVVSFQRAALLYHGQARVCHTAQFVLRREFWRCGLLCVVTPSAQRVGGYILKPSEAFSNCNLKPSLFADWLILPSHRISEGVASRLECMEPSCSLLCPSEFVLRILDKPQFRAR